MGKNVRLSGWIHRKRDHGGLLFIDLRDHYGLTQVLADSESPAFAALEQLRAESVIRIDGDGHGARARDREPEPADRRDRGPRPRHGGARAGRRAAAAGVRRADYPEEIRLKYRYLDLRRETLHRNIVLRSRVIAHPARRDERPGLHRVPDADPDRLLARGRARLPGALAPAPGQVLRAAAGAAAVQAAADGRGLRPLLPDRALLPRRGPARRPLARRVLPARRRDELRHPGRRVRGHRAGHARRLRGVRRRQAGDARSVPAHRLPRGDAQVRHRQARPAQPDRDAGRLRALPRRRASVFAGILEQEERGLGHPRAQGRQPAPSATG